MFAQHCWYYLVAYKYDHGQDADRKNYRPFLPLFRVSVNVPELLVDLWIIQ